MRKGKIFHEHSQHAPCRKQDSRYLVMLVRPLVSIAPMNPVLAFDIYGTLIDPYSMEQHLQPSFGNRARDATALWREKQIELSFRRALMRKYVDFNICTAQALDYVCHRFG